MTTRVTAIDFTSIIIDPVAIAYTIPTSSHKQYKVYCVRKLATRCFPRSDAPTESLPCSCFELALLCLLAPLVVDNLWDDPLGLIRSIWVLLVDIEFVAGTKQFLASTGEKFHANNSRLPVEKILIIQRPPALLR